MSGRQSNANRQQSQLPSVFDRLGSDRPRNNSRRGSIGRAGPPGRDGPNDRVITVLPQENRSRRDRMLQQEVRQDSYTKEVDHPRAPHDRPSPHANRSVNDVPVKPRPDRRYSREAEGRDTQPIRRSPERLPPQRERWSDSNREGVVESAPPPSRRYDGRDPPRYNRPEPYDRRRNDRLGGNQDRRYGDDRSQRIYQRRDDRAPAAPPHKPSPTSQQDENDNSNTRKVHSRGESVKMSPREGKNENDEQDKGTRYEPPLREASGSPSHEAEAVEEEELVKDNTEENQAPASAPLTSIVQRVFDRDEDEGIMQPDWGQDDDDLMDEDDFNVVVDAPEQVKQRDSTAAKAEKTSMDQPKSKINKNRNEEKDAANDKGIDKADSKDTSSAVKSEKRDTHQPDESSDPDIPSKDSLPYPWEKHKSSKGDYYYYNPETGQNTWKFPKIGHTKEPSESESTRTETVTTLSIQSTTVAPPHSNDDKDRSDSSLRERNIRRDTHRDTHAARISAPEEPSRPTSFDRHEHIRTGGKDQVREREHMIPPPAPKRMRRDIGEPEQRRRETGHQEVRSRQHELSSRASALPSQEDLFRRRDDFDRRSYRQPPPGRGPPPPRQQEPPQRRPLSPPPSQPMDVPPRRPRMSPPPPLASERRPGPPPRRQSSPLPPRPRRLDEAGPVDLPRRGREPYNVPPRDLPRPDRYHNRTPDNPNLVPLPVHHKDKAPRSQTPLSGANEVVPEQRRPIRSDESKAVSRHQEVITNSRIERNGRAHGRNQDDPYFSTRR